MSPDPTYTQTGARLRAPFMAVTAMATWAAIGIQFYITITRHPQDRTLPGVIVQFFSYFTIITNTLAAFSLSAMLFAAGSRLGKFFSRASVITAIAVYITVVGLVYALMLRSLWNFTKGFGMLSNEILHTGAPLLYLLFWLFFVNKNNLKWGSIFSWLWVPGVYIIYITLRGMLTGMYPYPFIDVSVIGYLKAITNAFILLGVFLGFSIILTSVGKFLAERQR